MSHYSYVTGKIQDVEALVSALKEFNFNPEVHEEPVNLMGYQDDTREDKAHVVVRKDQISRSSNDLGFLRTQEGFKTIISEYDQQNGDSFAGLGLGPNFMTKLQAEYAIKVVTKEISKVKGLSISSLERSADGKIRIVAQGKSNRSAIGTKLSSAI